MCFVFNIQAHGDTEFYNSHFRDGLAELWGGHRGQGWNCVKTSTKGLVNEKSMTTYPVLLCVRYCVWRVGTDDIAQLIPAGAHALVEES